MIGIDVGFERVWKERFARKVRKNVRKAERAGLVVESDASGRLLPEFYDLYLGWISRRAGEQGLPKSLMLQRAEPFLKYQAVAEKLGSACRVWIARLNKEPVAALITLIHGVYANSWRGCSNKELSAPVAANDSLLRIAIEYACNAGCQYYNMGWSSTTSLAAFKRSFGAVPRQFPVYTFDRLPVTQLEGLRNGLTHSVKRFLAHASRG
ncbi:MAG: GNAT family N-acetyltransferase [Actinomycetota bacterium]|nr:GNAT family N-acetyltransferase [Actinomycetota bacterium]